MENENNVYNGNAENPENNASENYGFANFDTDAAEPFSRTIHTEAEETSTPESDDYGDNFNSQTGDNADEENILTDDYDGSIEEYYINTMPSGGKSPDGRKNISNKTLAVVLTAAAVCVIAALVFVLAMCSGGKNKNEATASSDVTSADVSTQAEASAVKEKPTAELLTQTVTETAVPATQTPEQSGGEAAEIPAEPEAPIEPEQPEQSDAFEETDEIEEPEEAEPEVPEQSGGEEDIPVVEEN